MILQIVGGSGRSSTTMSLALFAAATAFTGVPLKPKAPAVTLHIVPHTHDGTPRAAAASALCVPRRPARPLPKLTSIASGRGR